MVPACRTVPLRSSIGRALATAGGASSLRRDSSSMCTGSWESRASSRPSSSLAGRAALISSRRTATRRSSSYRMSSAEASSLAWETVQELRAVTRTWQDLAHS